MKRRHWLICNAILCCLLVSNTLSAAVHRPQDFLKSIAGQADEGEKIVGHFCSVCHASNPDIPVGAPRTGVPEDWAPRLTLGLDVLFKHVDEGMGLMPPRGGCFECSDDQLRAAIKAMLPPQSTEKKPKVAR